MRAEQDFAAPQHDFAKENIKILSFGDDSLMTDVLYPATKKMALHTGGGRAKFREETPVTRQEEENLVLPVIIPALTAHVHRNIAVFQR